MNATRRITLFATLAATLLFCFSSLAIANTAPHFAGRNGTGPGEHFQIPFEPTGPSEGHWVLGDPTNGIPLIADPSAPPMEKWFMTPTGEPLQPGWSAPVWENFLVWPGDSAFPASPAITDWHEHIHEPGWIWGVPDEGSLDPPLITRDGEPWEWRHIPPPAGAEPNPAWLWVEFPPIGPGHVLDIHKQLIWEGVPGNTLWGDQILDDGTANEEVMVSVWEYPTIPEPSSLLLSSLALVGLSSVRRRTN